MMLLGFRGLEEKIKSIAAFSHRVAASTPYIIPNGWENVRELTVSVLKLWGEKNCSNFLPQLLFKNCKRGTSVPVHAPLNRNAVNQRPILCHRKHQ